MFGIFENKLYLAIFIVICIVVAYFLITYQIKMTVRAELIKMRKYKHHKRDRKHKQENYDDNRSSHSHKSEKSFNTEVDLDIDSYVDPIQASNQ